MEDRETPRMRKYGESKTTQIMMATVPHVTPGSGLRKFQAHGYLLDRVYNCLTSGSAYCSASQNSKKDRASERGSVFQMLLIMICGTPDDGQSLKAK